MGIFRKRNTRTIAELEDYYTSQQSTGMAWIMAFLSLFVTVAVLSGLFFGGRWIYRTVSGDNAIDVTTSTEINPAFDDDIDVVIDAQLSESVDGSDQESAITGGSVSRGGVVSDEAARTNSPSTQPIVITPTVRTTPTSSASQPNNESDIPNTGAGEVLVITPIIAVIFGYVISIRKQANVI